MNASRPLAPDTHPRSVAAAALVAFGALAGTACGGGEAGTSSDVVRRDSAGIEIVRSDAPAWSADERWRVETDDPLLDVGSASGPADQELYQVSGLARLSDGRWVVANGGTNELRYFAPDGELLFRAGSEGEGPGEFQRLSGLARLPGDSLLAWEALQSRVSVFGPDGGFVRSVRLEEPPSELEGAPDDASVSRATPRARFADGSLLAQGNQVMGAEGLAGGGIRKFPRIFVRYGPEGSYREFLAVYPGSSRWLQVDIESESIQLESLLFGTGTHSAATADAWYVGHSDRYEIAARRPDGTVTRLVRRRHEPEEVSDADVDARIETRLEPVDDPAARADRREVFTEMPVPETFPAFDDLAVSRDGHLWVQNYRKPGDPTPPWSVFAPEGRWLGDVELPDNFDPMWIDDEVVAGVWEDELEVEHLRAYRIVKP